MAKSRQIEDVMSRPRNQITITLSDGALREYELVAQWKGQPTATYLREILEQHHVSLEFGSAVERAKKALEDSDSD